MSRTGFAVLILCTAFTRSAGAQSALDKIIGADGAGEPIVITHVEAQVIGRIAKAADAPMGIEIAPGRAPKSRPRKLTGLTIRAAVEVLSEIDPRYEWREVNGVIVLRAPSAWSAQDHPLALPVQQLELRDIRARNALSVVAAFLGAPQYADTQLGDTKRFSVHLNGGTVFDLLNAVVSAHGELAWSFEGARITPMNGFPFIVTIYAGSTGTGCGVPGHSPDSPVNVARYADPPVLAKGGSTAVLDRIVGRGPNQLRLVVHGPSESGVFDLANATRVPMGIEFLNPASHFQVPDIPATGRTLREVLDAMIAVDPRYEWREMDGVIVIRPVGAWNDPRDMLFRIVEPIHLIDVTPDDAIRRIAREVGYPHPITAFPGKPMSLDLPQGTVLDLANAIVRAHGELTWALVPDPPLDGAAVGYTHTFTFRVMGGVGIGFGAR